MWNAADIHEICAYRQKLYVIDTFGNRLLEFRGPGDQKDPFGLSLSRFWDDPQAREPDSTHLTSVVCHHEKLLVARFGPFCRHREYVERGRSGQILDVSGPFQDKPSPAKVVVDGLADPHSLLIREGELCFTEARRRIARLGEARWHSPVGGYVRGLCPVPDGWLIGVSGSRHSQHTGPPRAQIYWTDFSGASSELVSELPASEVYSIVPLDALRT